MTARCRPPHGGRGLKCEFCPSEKITLSSPPSRGAWIEINCRECEVIGHESRPPRGGRGLKLHLPEHRHPDRQSPPSRGAWIEMVWGEYLRGKGFRSPPSRGAWIEIHTGEAIPADVGRPPHRGRGLKFKLPVADHHGVIAAPGETISGAGRTRPAPRFPPMRPAHSGR